MKRLIYVFLFLALPVLAFAQLYGTGIGYVNDFPTHTPNISQKGSELCVSINRKMIYQWHRDSSKWKPLMGITLKYGPPTTAPTTYETRTAINIQNGLIYWWNGTTWKEIISYAVELSNIYAAGVAELYANQVRAELADSILIARNYIDSLDALDLDRDPSNERDTLYLTDRSGTSQKVNTDTINLEKYIERGDTSAMLTRYIERGDTTAMLTRYIERGDTSAMLTRYIERSDTATMLAYYPSTGGFGIIKTSKTIRVDTLKLATKYYASSLLSGVGANQIAYGSPLSGSSNFTYSSTKINNTSTNGYDSYLSTYTGTSNRRSGFGADGFTISRTSDGDLISGGAFYRFADQVVGITARQGGVIAYDTRQILRWNDFGVNIERLTSYGVASNGPHASSLFDVTSTIKGSRPFPLQTQAQADAIVGTQGLFQYETTQNGLRGYNGTRKFYYPESTVARFTANHLPYIDANGQFKSDSKVRITNDNQLRIGATVTGSYTDVGVFTSGQVRADGGFNLRGTNAGDNAMTGFVSVGGIMEFQLGNIGVLQMRAGGSALDHTLQIPRSANFGGVASATNITTGIRLAGSHYNQGAGLYSGTASGFTDATDIGNSGNFPLPFKYNCITLTPMFRNAGNKVGIIFAPIVGAEMSGSSIIGFQNTVGDNYFNSISGSTGIKTTSPQQELDVNGDFRVRDSTDLDITPSHTTITGILTRDITGWVGAASIAGGLNYSGGVLTGQNIYNTNGTFGAGRIGTLTDSLRFLFAGNDLFRLKSNGVLHVNMPNESNSFVITSTPSENYNNFRGNVYVSGTASNGDTLTNLTRRNNHDASYFSGINLIEGGNNVYYDAVAGYGNVLRGDKPKNIVYGVYNTMNGNDNNLFGYLNSMAAAGSGIFGQGLTVTTSNVYAYGSGTPGITRHGFGTVTPVARIHAKSLSGLPTILVDGGEMQANAYGVQAKEAADLSKTFGNLTAFSTDGTFIDLGIGTGLTISGGVLTAPVPTQILHEQYNTVTSTSSPVTLSNTQSDNLINQGSTQASFTLLFPATPSDGQILTITYNNAITTLTLDGNGNTIVGSAVTTAVPGSQRKFKFYAGIGWIKIY